MCRRRGCHLRADDPCGGTSTRKRAETPCGTRSIELSCFQCRETANRRSASFSTMRRSAARAAAATCVSRSAGYQSRRIQGLCSKPASWSSIIRLVVEVLDAVRSGNTAAPLNNPDRGEARPPTSPRRWRCRRRRTALAHERRAHRGERRQRFERPPKSAVPRRLAKIVGEQQIARMTLAAEFLLQLHQHLRRSEPSDRAGSRRPEECASRQQTATNRRTACIELQISEAESGRPRHERKW